MSARSLRLESLFVLFLLLCCQSRASLAAVNDTVLAINCTTTPAIWSLESKPPIYATNNLRQRVGSAYSAYGTNIVIEGRVLDSQCVPVANAVVQIWQNDGLGAPHYRVKGNYVNDSNLYSKQSSFVARSNEDTDMYEEIGDPHFTGSGTCITDSLGNYRFYTVMPKSLYADLAKKIYFYVKYRVGVIQTQMVFSENEAARDREFRESAIHLNERKRLIAQRSANSNYRFDIVVPRTFHYRQY